MGDRAIQEAIRKLSGVDADDSIKLVACTVVSVDMAARTCVATTITGKSEMDIPNIQLIAGVNDGLILQPTVGSMIYVAYSRRNFPFVLMYSQIDDVFLVCPNVKVNDGSYGGLVKIIDLTTKLNNLVSFLQGQLTSIASGIVAGGGTYTPGTIPTFNKTDYENTEFTHGT